MARRGLSVRQAIDWVRIYTPDDWLAPEAVFARDEIAADFARSYAGVPATSVHRDEKVVRYSVADSPIPVLLGLYGSADRMRGLLPGLPPQVDRDSAGKLLAAAVSTSTVTRPPCQQVRTPEVNLRDLPALITTPRDAGPYLTMGVVYATDPTTGAVALSVHRILVVDRTRLAIWMVPGRALRLMHEDALRRGERLAVSVNIGAPPAVLIASALSSAVLPAEVGKLEIAGALAGGAVTIADAVSVDTSVLAESEIVLEGYLDDSVVPEALDGDPDRSLPEFLGYDGEARPDLPVLTVTAVTTRLDPLYQAVIGPGREQSVILGLAGELSVALSADDPDIADLHFSAAGGGMLLLVIAVRHHTADSRLAAIAKQVFDHHRFVKLIIFTDEDVDVRCAEDVLWAVTTRSKLSADVGTFSGFAPLGMDPSQRPEWGRGDGGDRSYLTATVPHALRDKVTRSFPGGRP